MIGRGGYALRRNESCLSTERDCGPTTDPFHACCPSDMFCPGQQENVVCCYSEGGCEEVRGEECADPLANLYTTNAKNLTNGGFCCAKDKTGFWIPGDGSGCADDIKNIRQGQHELSIVSSALVTPTPSSSSISSLIVVSTSTTASSSPTSTTDAKPSSSNNTGAIAGGVAGGVVAVAITAALLWFFLRRRKGLTPEDNSNHLSSQSGMLPKGVQDQQPSKTEHQQSPHELHNRRETPISELSSARDI